MPSEYCTYHECAHTLPDPQKNASWLQSASAEQRVSISGSPPRSIRVIVPPSGNFLRASGPTLPHPSPTAGQQPAQGREAAAQGRPGAPPARLPSAGPPPAQLPSPPSSPPSSLRSSLRACSCALPCDALASRSRGSAVCPQCTKAASGHRAPNDDPQDPNAMAGP